MLNLDSSEPNQLKKFLDDYGLNFISEIRANRTPPVDFALVISADRVREKVGKGYTSRRQMKMVEETVKEKFGYVIEWIVTPSEEGAVLEAALLELLSARFPSVFTTVIMSAPKTPPVSVWVQCDPNARSMPDPKEVDALIFEFLALYGIQEPIVVHESNLPSKPMILRALKIKAPIRTPRLANVLRSDGSTVPTDHWLQNKLDALRKEGLIIRASTGEYALTERGLSLVPHGKHRSSSDIERALAFGRRQW
jgi:hypothetical protein